MYNIGFLPEATPPLMFVDVIKLCGYTLLISLAERVIFILLFFICTVHGIICTLCLYHSLPQVCSALYQFITNKVNVFTETQELYMYLVNYLYRPCMGLLH